MRRGMSDLELKASRISPSEESPRSTRSDSDRVFRCKLLILLVFMVEVPGIEPGSEKESALGDHMLLPLLILFRRA
ncbi:MAG: hypothetical protein RIR26_2171 [Pseudomonadota bacterium]